MREVWKRVPGHELEASNLGRIRVPAKILVPKVYVQNNYARVEVRHKVVARLVLLAFKGPPPLGSPLALHRDDNSKNNELKNLRWGSHQINCDDAVRNGHRGVGSQHHLAKLTEYQALEILVSKESYSVLAKRYDISRATVQAIKGRRSWKHLKC